MENSSDKKPSPENTVPTLSPKEAAMLLGFLNRVDLKGAESEAHAYLKAKLALIRDGTPLGSVHELTGERGSGVAS